MLRTRLWPAAAAVLLASTAVAGPAAPAPAPAARRVFVTRRAAEPPSIDGRLDDGAWALVEWSGDFVQREPADGPPPTRQTMFKVVYDDTALYVAFRACDDRDGVVSLLDRRDRFPGDWVEINIDSYFDHRTAFSFTLSLSGTRGDELISNDGNRWDANWDPVWDGATRVDDEGWTGEMRIPLSQLRFSGEASQTWGLQVQRRIFRLEERSTWQRIPRDVSGWVSRFGELRGLDGLEPGRRLELLPYSSARAETFAPEAGNPFSDGSSTGGALGLDGKLGVTSDLTLDFTLNPDFGQVEADPSEVNLTAFETFFEEKRPFFIEGSDILDLRLAPAIAGGPFTQDRLFYSRRIGGAVPASPDLADDEYADEPAVTSILGAFKLSGKTGGLSIGVMDSVTAEETALVDAGGLRRQEAVSPLTNWFVGRVQQDLRGGDTQIGAMLTAVHRDVSSPGLEFLARQAWAGGIDFSHYFGNRAYRIEGNLLGSRLSGSTEAIEEAQTSSARYFQRPGGHASFDATRTSLGGHAGSVRLTRTKQGSGFRFQTGVAWRSPGFEINDLGFMRSADEINQFGWAAYQVRNPFGIFRRLEVNANEWLDWDFGGQLLRAQANTNANATFRNNYAAGLSLTRRRESVSNTELRGGPASTWPGAWQYEVWAQSDSRRSVRAGAGTWGREGDEGSEHSRETWLDVTYRPTHALSVTLSPSYRRYRPELQYVDTVAFGDAERYLFGRLDQKTLAVTLRVDLSITPDLTIQYYGAPFVSTGRYSDLARIVRPRASEYRDRFETFAPAQVGLDAAAESYGFDEDRDGTVDYSVDRPDFDFREFRSTLVVRWEYSPGSLLYLVWSQSRLDETLGAAGFAPGRSVRTLFDTAPHDVFLVKLSKWFSF